MTAGATLSSISHHNRGDLICLALLAMVEAVIFYSHVHFNIAPFYPPAFDQLSYYLETYDIVAAIHKDGAAAIWHALFAAHSATGTTFTLQGAVLSLMAPPSRTTFLTVNLLYLVATQTILFLAVRSFSNAMFGWTALGLFLSTQTLLNGAGGIYDYRIDFMALCLYGICLSSILWSRLFLDTRKAIFTAFICIALIYARFFTIIYIGGFLGLLIAIQLLVLVRSSPPARDHAGRRMRNIFVCGIIMAAICLPRLYVSKDAIYNYYMIGHVLGEEKYIRAAELGIHGLAGHLLYYPASIARSHIGTVTWILAGLLLITSFVRAPVAIPEAGRRLRAFWSQFATLFASLLVPIAVLTANISKSQVVGGIATVPIVLIFTLIGLAIWPNGVFFQVGKRSVNAAVIAVVIGLGTFAIRAHPWPAMERRADLEKISALNTTIARYAADRKLDRISLSIDRVSDFANAGSPALFSIEQFDRPLVVEGLFGYGGYGIFATPREDALRLFEQSDVVIMTDPNKDRAQAYPINTKIREYWPELWQWTNQQRRLIYSTTIYGVPYYVFAR